MKIHWAALAFTAFVLLADRPVQAQPSAQTGAVAALAHDLDQAESLRAVKRLQVAHAQFTQYRLWDALALLYADDAEAIFGETHVKGRDAIRRQIEARMGMPPPGPQAHVLSVELAMTPIVTMSPGGDHAKGRWHIVSLSGRKTGPADWAGGIVENEYTRGSDGVWRISRLHYHPYFAGPYERGWTNVPDDLAIVPYHFTAEQAGKPIPPTGAPAAPRGADQDTTFARRIAALNAEDEVRNLQNIYGYYIDRKMWDDVGDLFEADATLEIAGTGIWDGARSIRRGLERDGPPGIREGEVNDRIQLNMIVTILPGGNTAQARGTEFGMIGKNNENAYWTIATFENDYVRRDGKWRIARMRLYPQLRTDYYQGWSKSWLGEPEPLPAFAPDRPLSALGAMQMPAFRIQHPTTGEAIPYPAAARPVAIGNEAP